MATDGQVTINGRDDIVYGSTVTIPVLLSNAIPVRALVIPLVIRPDSGAAAPVSIQLAFRERLTVAPSEPLMDFVYTNLYYLEDGHCKSNQPGGFGHLAFPDTLVHPIPVLPAGVLFVRGRLTEGDLPPGDDATGSLQMTMSLNQEVGCFVIDTTCVDPANHLLFSDVYNADMPVTFQRGRFCTTEPPACQCQYIADFNADGFLTAEDLAQLIDILFANATDQWDHYCPVSRADADCSSYVDVLDLSLLIDHLYASGPPPCDPCAP
jgi:hypothetical protein